MSVKQPECPQCKSKNIFLAMRFSAMSMLLPVEKGKIIFGKMKEEVRLPATNILRCGECRNEFTEGMNDLDWKKVTK